MRRKELTESVFDTLAYFAHFSYAPTRRELYMFLTEKVSYPEYESELVRLSRSGKIAELDGFIATLGHKDLLLDAAEKIHRTKTKLKKVTLFLRIAVWIPQISFIGLSGSLAMNNAMEDDDIDLFVISSRKRIWTSRILLLGISTVLGLRRKRGDNHYKDKICLNLFFDERDMMIPSKKRTYFGAHEILQLKPFAVQSQRWNQTYRTFLSKNEWVFTIFPNASTVAAESTAGGIVVGRERSWLMGSFRTIGDIFERCARSVQMLFINRHRTVERISDTQLWFFPHDREIDSKNYKNTL